MHVQVFTFLNVFAAAQAGLNFEAPVCSTWIWINRQAWEVILCRWGYTGPLLYMFECFALGGLGGVGFPEVAAV